MAFVALWPQALWSVYEGRGLFRWLGVDYGYYFAQSMALWSGDPSAMYSLEEIGQYMQTLAVYTVEPHRPLVTGPVPYPPVFAWAFTPFIRVSPPAGFLAWSILNVAAALCLAWRAGEAAKRYRRLAVVLIVATALPVVYAVWLGQAALLVACAFTEFFLALRAGRDLRAGLWLSLVLLKPQYGVLLGLVLIWKRRWLVVLGVAVGGAILLLGSLLAAGPAAVLAYPGSILQEGDLGGFRAAGVGTYPRYMINWRAALQWLPAAPWAPWTADQSGFLLTVALSAATAAGALWLWRGRWLPGDPQFPLKVSATLGATLLISYHSHLHGAALLAGPLAAALAEARLHRATRVVIGAAIIVPTALFLVTHSIGRSSQAFCALLIASFVGLAVDGGLVRELLRLVRRARRAPTRDKVRTAPADAGAG